MVVSANKIHSHEGLESLPKAKNVLSGICRIVGQVAELLRHRLKASIPDIDVAVTTHSGRSWSGALATLILS